MLKLQYNFTHKLKTAAVQSFFSSLRFCKIDPANLIHYTAFIFVALSALGGENDRAL